MTLFRVITLFRVNYPMSAYSGSGKSQTAENEMDSIANGLRIVVSSRLIGNCRRRRGSWNQDQVSREHSGTLFWTLKDKPQFCPIQSVKG